MSENGQAPLVAVEETDPSRRTRILDGVRRLGAIGGRLALTGSLTIVGGIAAMEAWGEETADIGPATVTAQANFGLSGDVIAETSLGSARIDLTDGPIGMRIRMTGVESNAPKAVQKELDNQAQAQPVNFSPETAFQPYEDKLYAVGDWAKRKGALAGLGGGFLGALSAEALWALGRTVRRREIPEKEALIKIGIRSLLLPMFTLYAAAGWGIATYNEEAVKHPQFGNDSFAELVDFVSKSMASRDKYIQGSAYLNEWLSDLLAYRQFPELPKTDSNLIPALVMADAHERVCVYELVKTLVDRFDAAFVLNAGDEKDGNPLLVPHLVGGDQCPDNTMESLGVPVVVSPGNHDGKEDVKIMDAYPNVIVPFEETVNLTLDTPEGKVTFKIVGGPDPRHTPDFSKRPLLAEETAAVTQFGERIGHVALRDNPDIILVHDPRAGNAIDALLGEERKAWIFQGHAHRFSLNLERKRLTVGSVGGSGLHTMEYQPHEEQGTSQATIVYFDPRTKQPVWGINFQVQNNGRSTAEPIFFDSTNQPTVTAKQPD